MDGLPPNSYGPVVVGGFDIEIANAIFNTGPGGIESFGTTVVTINDAEGWPWEIGFTRPQPIYIWLKISYVLNPEEVFPINGVELIGENVEAWGTVNLSVGIDLIFQRLHRPIYNVNGISFAQILVAATYELEPPQNEDYVEANIAINKRQIGIIDRSRIIIRELTE